MGLQKTYILNQDDGGCKEPGAVPGVASATSVPCAVRAAVTHSAGFDRPGRRRPVPVPGRARHAPRPRSVIVTTGKPRSSAVERNQASRARGAGSCERRPSRQRRVEPEVAAPRPPQRLEAGAGPDQFAERMGERPHVEPGRAGERHDGATPPSNLDQLGARHLTGTGVSVDRPGPARASCVGAAARRPSSPRRPAASAGTRRSAPRARRATASRDGHGIGPACFRAGDVVGVGRQAEADRRVVVLVGCRQEPHQPRGAAAWPAAARRWPADRACRYARCGARRARAAPPPRRRATSGPAACRRRERRPSRCARLCRICARIFLLEHRASTRLERRRVALQPEAFLWPPPPNSFATALMSTSPFDRMLTRQSSRPFSLKNTTAWMSFTVSGRLISPSVSS